MCRLFLSLVILVTISCSSDEQPSSSEEITSSAYFPLEIGHISRYSVEENIVRNVGNQIDTLRYQVEERVVDTFVDDTRQTIYVVDRYIRASETSAWRFDKSWSAQIVNNRAIRIEDNRKFIKFRLPIEADDVWNGNLLFDDSAPIIIGDQPIEYYKNWESKFESMNQNETIGNSNFEDVNTVSLVNYENKLELRYGIEKYAAGIGLIYKELRILDTQCFNACNNISWLEKAEGGHTYKQQIIIQ